MTFSQYKSVNALSITKFILILFVVLIHCKIPEKWDANKSGLETISLIDEFIRVSVPCFFIISGYLYFRDIKNFSFHLYFIKSIKRIHSLVIPYILWNSIFLSYLIYKACYNDNSFLEIFPYGKNYLLNLLFIIKGYWSFENGYPYAFAFWFIRNLIIFCALSPLVYFLVKKKYLFFILIFLIFLFNIDLFGFEYFIFGAFLKYNSTYPKANIRSVKVLIYTGGLWVLLATLLWHFTLELNIIEFTESFITLLFLLNLSEILMVKADHKILNKCVTSTFFIYAIHQFFASPLKKIYHLTFNLDVYWGVIEFYIACFISLIIISLIIWKLLSKISPKITNILSGGRF